MADRGVFWSNYLTLRAEGFSYFFSFSYARSAAASGRRITKEELQARKPIVEGILRLEQERYKANWKSRWFFIILAILLGSATGHDLIGYIQQYAQRLFKSW